jgi:hypothetical protein
MPNFSPKRWFGPARTIDATDRLLILQMVTSIVGTIFDRASHSFSKWNTLLSSVFL